MDVKVTGSRDGGSSGEEVRILMACLVLFLICHTKSSFFYELSLWSNLAATVFLRTLNLLIFYNVPVTVDLKIIDLSRIPLQ